MSDLSISFIQADLDWENAESNRLKLEEKINELEKTNLILLPEMFTTAFTMNSSEMAETMEGESIAWMASMAKAKNAIICGSLIIEEKKSFYNRLIWMKPDGSFRHYDKRHLFRMADEEKYFSQGNEKLITEIEEWKIIPLICYDLRFPVWSRNKYDQLDGELIPQFDLMIYVANWPAARKKAWSKLLQARAIENQVYVAGLNRVGEDGKGIAYAGGSILVDPKGEIIWEAGDEEINKTLEIDLESLNQFRKKFPLGLDADEFELKNKG